MYYYLAVVAKDRYLDTIQGGGEDEYLSIPRENGQKLLLKLFLSDGKIVYQDLLQLPVPLNTLYIYIQSHTASFKSIA